jgi:hypothetical protein
MDTPPLPNLATINQVLARRSLRHYLESVVIDCQPVPRPFGQVSEKWQWDTLLNPLIPAIEDIAALKLGYDGPRSFWFTFPRGSDKTSSIGRICNWCLSYAKRNLSISVAAAAQKQAKFVRDAMLTEAKLNDWFGRDIKIDNWQATGPSGELEILSASEASSYGMNSHIYIMDELTHWPRRGLWTALQSGVMKRPGCLLIIISNAGYCDTWQEEVYLEVKRNRGTGSKDWHLYEAPGLMAGWVDRERLARERGMLPPHEAARLYDNVWIPSTNNAAFNYKDIEAMFTEESKSQLILV